MEWLVSLFSPTENPTVTQSIILIFIAIGTGIFIGRLRFKGVSLGVSAVMFSSILLGHYGYRIDEELMHFIRDVGLMFFVYAIGIQVGPSFFSSFRKEGIRLNILAVSTVLLGGFLTFLIYHFTSIGVEHSVGMMSGAVTNTPGLGAAKATIQEIAKIFPERKFLDPANAYAITYPVGVLGLIFLIILAKNFFKIDTKKEVDDFEKVIQSDTPKIVYKKCRILQPEFFGKTIYHALKTIGIEHVIVSRLKRSGSKIVFSPSLDTQLQERDVIMLVGKESDVDEAISKLGRVSTDNFIDSDVDITQQYLFVTKKSAVHKTLAALDLFNKFDLKVTRVVRSGMELLAHPSLELFYGDKLKVVGNRDAIKEAEKIVGNSEKKLVEPDFLSLFGGLLAGIVLGSFPILLPHLPVPIKLGFAAGPLLVAMLVSRYGGLGIVHSYLNIGAVHFMKDLGICLFFAAVGIHAGERFYADFIEFNGWNFMLLGSLITLIPLVFMLLIGRYVMKLNFVQLTGVMSGTYTDPAALSFSNTYFNSDIPAQSYATVYPLVTIFRILVAQLLVIVLL